MISNKQIKKGLAICMALIMVVLTLGVNPVRAETAAEAAAALAATISNHSCEVGSITATAEDSTVTVTGEATVTTMLTLNIAEGVTVKWAAELTRSENIYTLGTMVRIGGNGTFEVVEDGVIKCDSLNEYSNGFFSMIEATDSATVTINGGTISTIGGLSTSNVAQAINISGESNTINIISGKVVANGNYSAAIYAYNKKAMINIRGGEVEKNSTNADNSYIAAIYVENTTESAEINITGGSVKTGSKFNAINVVSPDVEINISGDSTVVEGQEVINLNGTESTINVKGGTLSGRTSAITTTYGSNSTINVTGGKVLSTEGFAIVAGEGNNVTVSDGVVNAVNLYGANSKLTVSGGEVLSTGTNPAIEQTGQNTTVIISGGLVSSEAYYGIRVAGIDTTLIVSDGEVRTNSTFEAIYLSSYNYSMGRYDTISAYILGGKIAEKGISKYVDKNNDKVSIYYIGSDNILDESFYSGKNLYPLDEVILTNDDNPYTYNEQEVVYGSIVATLNSATDIITDAPVFEAISSIEVDGSDATGTPDTINGTFTFPGRQHEKDVSLKVACKIQGIDLNIISKPFSINVAKEQVEISGLSKDDTIYTGSPHKGYTGTPIFKDKSSTIVTLDDATFSTQYTGTEINDEPYDSEDPPTNAGSYNVKLWLEKDSKYGGEWTAGFEITQKPLDEDMIEEVEEVTYTGSEHTPNIIVTDFSNPKEEVDYTISYLDNINVGTAIATITATEKGNYSGEASINFKIIPKDSAIEDLDYELKDVDYNGFPQEVNVTAKPDLKGFGEITVMYDDSDENPTNAKTYSITVDIADGENYKAVSDLTLGEFTINKINPTKDVLDISSLKSVAYNGSQQGVDISEKTNINGLGEITVKYGDSLIIPKNAGTYPITVEIEEGTNYNGTTLELGDFIIEQAEIGVDITISSYYGTYDGIPHSPTITDSGGGVITYSSEDDGTYSETPIAYTDAGMYTVYFKVTRNDANYKDFSGSAIIQIYKKYLDNSMFEYLPNVTYTGTAHEPDVTVTDSSLIKESDFTVSYTDNTDVGTATVIITANPDGNFTGTVYRYFQITAVAKPKPTTSDLDYIIPTTLVIYDGLEHAVDVKAKSHITGLGDITVKYNNLTTVPKDTGYYAVSVDISEGDYYSATTLWLGSFTIIEDNEIIELPYNGTYDGLPHSATITDSGGGTITYSSEADGTYTETPVTYIDVGVYIVYYKVSRTEPDSEQKGSTTITINKKNLASSMIGDIPNLPYTGIEQEPEIIVTDSNNAIKASDYTISYKNNTDAGTATVTITATQDGNYTGTASKDFQIIEIDKLTPTTSELDYVIPTTPVIYDGLEHAVEVTAKSHITGLGYITVKYNGLTTIPIDKGTYTVTVDITEGDNYYWSCPAWLNHFIITPTKL